MAELDLVLIRYAESQPVFFRKYGADDIYYGYGFEKILGAVYRLCGLP